MYLWKKRKKKRKKNRWFKRVYWQNKVVFFFCKKFVAIESRLFQVLCLSTFGKERKGMRVFNSQMYMCLLLLLLWMVIYFRCNPLLCRSCSTCSKYTHIINLNYRKTPLHSHNNLCAYLFPCFFCHCCFFHSFHS